MNIFTNDAKSLLVRAMDAAMMRNQVLADNLANVETPEYKRKEVMFEDLLRMQANQAEGAGKVPMRKTHAKHLGLGGTVSGSIMPQIRTIHELSYRNDKNNVDIDVETVKLSQNKIAYDAYTQCVSNETKLMRLAITGRNG